MIVELSVRPGRFPDRSSPEMNAVLREAAADHADLEALVGRTLPPVLADAYALGLGRGKSLAP
jgi:hypothetical protein